MRSNPLGNHRSGILVPSIGRPVCTVDVNGELRGGQVWFRRGTRNTLATHADLKRMFTPPEPLRTTQNDGALVKQVKEYWEPQGWEVFWADVNDRDEKIAQGYRIA